MRGRLSLPRRFSYRSRALRWEGNFVGAYSLSAAVGMLFGFLESTSEAIIKARRGAALHRSAKW